MKTVILAWTHKVCNLVTTETDNFWGLGDTIRGTIHLFQLSKKMGFRLIVDIQLHNVSHYLKQHTHEFDRFVLENKNKIPFISDVEQYIESSSDDVLIFLTNGSQRLREPISEECKLFIKEILCPNEEFDKHIRTKMERLPSPHNYSVLHYRLNDIEMINIDNNKAIYDKYLENLLSNVEEDSILISTSKKFKDFVKTKNSVFMFDIDIGHLGYAAHKDIIKDTLYEFFLLSRARLIKTHSVYRWLSGFASVANQIYDVPLQRI
uniref:Uncharacterized protein n=1 Tax=viral metagenome TaxID=1070528 RepID=A0A6C0JIW6_9ZZZZ